MEGFLNLIAGYFGGGFSLIWALYTAYMGEDSSILGTNEMFGDEVTESPKVERFVLVEG